MSKQKLLSIVIPSYNMEKYLKKCCESLVISDNFELLDVLIINDGSKDETSQIAHDFQKKYSNVFRVIDKENGNYGSCINRGLKEAAGQFIKILDADDSYNNDNLNNYVKFLLNLSDDERATLDLIITGTVLIDEHGKCNTQKVFALKPYIILDFETFKKSNVSLTHHSVTYRTEILRQLNYCQTEKISYTDQEWVLLPLLNVRNVVYYPLVVYRYLIGRSGQTMERKTFVGNMWMQIEIKKHIIVFYEERHRLYPIANQDYVNKRINHSIGLVYAHYLMHYRQFLKVSELVDFDSFLKVDHQDIYMSLYSQKYSKLFPVRYIAYWRQAPNGWKYNMTYSIYSFGVYLKKIAKKILGLG